MTFNFSMQAIDHVINSASKTFYMSAGLVCLIYVLCCALLFFAFTYIFIFIQMYFLVIFFPVLSCVKSQYYSYLYIFLFLFTNFLVSFFSCIYCNFFLFSCIPIVIHMYFLVIFFPHDPFCYFSYLHTFLIFIYTFSCYLLLMYLPPPHHVSTY